MNDNHGGDTNDNDNNKNKNSYNGKVDENKKKIKKNVESQWNPAVLIQVIYLNMKPVTNKTPPFWWWISLPKETVHEHNLFFWYIL